MSVKVKVCGVTRTEDAIAVIDAGADALGLNFVESSPRYVDLEVAKELSDVSAGLIARVGVFLDASQQQIEDTIKRVDLDFLQFHGSEEASECEKWGIPYVKAFRVTKIWASRVVSTRVFPVPAPARTRTGPSIASTASR